MLKPALQRAAREAGEELAAETADGGPAVLIGTPLGRGGKRLQRGRACSMEGTIAAVRYKIDLPNYGVFDEKRVFEPAPIPGPIHFPRRRLGVPICEDIWDEEACESLAETGAESADRAQRLALLDRASRTIRYGVADARVTETGLPLVYRQPGRRPGRTGLRWRLVRAQRRQLAGRAAAGLGGSGRSSPNGSRDGGRLALPRRARSSTSRGGRRGQLPRLRAGLARLRRQERLSRRGARACRAASIRRCARRWPSMRWARRACTA